MISGTREVAKSALPEQGPENVTNQLDEYRLLTPRRSSDTLSANLCSVGFSISAEAIHVRISHRSPLIDEGKLAAGL